MAVLFGGKCTDSLATMRYNIFSKKVVSASTTVTPEPLPPTESASKFHSRRANYQIMTWMGTYDDMEICPTNVHNECCPRQSLEGHSLTCSTACKTLHCSCIKYGFVLLFFGPCQLQECDNPHNTFLPEER